jgi:hypothetical protein
MPLIRELRIAEDKAKTEVVVDEEAEEAKHMEAATDALQGEVISHALNFLSQEMVRLQEERKIMQYFEHAKWSRRVREAEESGRRQMEHLTRMKQEEQFKLVMDVHSKSAHIVMDNAVRSAVAHSADTMAVKATTIKRDHLDPAEDGLEKESDPASVVADLLTSLIMPQVAKEHARRAQKVQERRFVDAAHHATLVVVEDSALITNGEQSLRRDV